MDAIVDKVIFFALGYNSMCDICFQNNELFYVKIKFKYIYFYTHIIPLSKLHCCEFFKQIEKPDKLCIRFSCFSLRRFTFLFF